MNIREAKEQIKQSISIYLAKDEYGNYKIPIEKQRPVFLIGAPGIGKTAIMEQIASELDIAIVSYSMTHHTRQSALGLPFIIKKKFGNEEFDVSEYTMSEIIASVYETMEKSGKKEGILFLDEINCVSETLAPSMLQFLQYKIFGNHQVPQGWVVCTAGNPPEFNKSVHEFDVVTMDRLKVMEATADYDVWKVYAEKKGVHKSITTYLDIKQSHFYRIENTVDGKAYVTARGWEDLSEAIYLYEEKGFDVSEALISQYIRDKKISGSFATYYELYEKYKADYGIRQILKEGKNSEALHRAKEAEFDERTTVVGLLLEAIIPLMHKNIEQMDGLKSLFTRLKDIEKENDVIESLLNILNLERENVEKLKNSSNITKEAKILSQFREAFIENVIQEIRLNTDQSIADFDILKNSFNEKISTAKLEATEIKAQLDNLFDFIEAAFGDENEMLLLVTDLTINHSSARFITENGCDKYYQYNKKLMLQERNKNLIDEINEFKKLKETNVQAVTNI